jgi:hypothetical protein
MSTCNRLDLQTLGSQPVMPKNLPNHWSRDNALDIALDSSGSWDCEGLTKHNFLNTCLNGASEVTINIYMKCR